MQRIQAQQEEASGAMGEVLGQHWMREECTTFWPHLMKPYFSNLSNHKRRVKKAGLKLNIQKMKIMASGSITSWQIDVGKVETAADFLGLQNHSDGNCSHEIKRLSLLGRKAITNLDSILKGRDITLLTKVHLVKAMVFLVVMYGYESWTIKKAEH